MLNDLHSLRARSLRAAALLCGTLAASAAMAQVAPAPPATTATPAAPVVVTPEPASTTLAANPATPAQPLPDAPAPVATLYGNVKVERATAGPMPLSLDDAITRALAHNLQMLVDKQNERSLDGQRLLVLNAILANLTAKASTSTQEINLAAMGFKPAALGPVLAQFGLSSSAFSQIVKVDVTQAQLSVSQYLFNAPAYELVRGAQKLTDVARLTTSNDRDSLALQTGTQYLRVLADTAQLNNDFGQVKEDTEELRQSQARLDAGVGVRLDVLRDQVALQTEQQARIHDEAQLAKDTIQLNRLMGLPAEQQLALTDAVPFQELQSIPLFAALKLAYENRYDLKVLLAEQEVADRSRLAARYERLPTVSFDGYYGVIGETRGLYHGDFVAEGSLKFPIFQEAQFRGESEVASSQLSRIRNQILALRQTIDAELRSNMLDVQSTQELVRVARSNVDLATETLNDARQRYQAGVDDNLPVVTAQAQLASAQNKLVQNLFQYNQAKLSLARATGVIETDYRQYLGH